MDEKIIFELTQSIDKNRKTPIYTQLADALRILIESRALKPNNRLPSIRALADALDINNLTVKNAYNVLLAKGLAYALRGSGTYVADVTLSSHKLPTRSIESEGIQQAPPLDGVVNFASTSTNTALFPVDEFKEHFNRVLDRDRGNAFEYAFSQGYEPLRDALCAYMSQFAIQTTVERVHIISGAQQGVDVVAKALIRLNDAVIVEEPTYSGAVGAFQMHGAAVFAVEIQSDGADLEKLTALIQIKRPKLLYLMSYYQTPTCACYSMEKKLRILELAEKFDFYIIEEDNQSDFCYENPAPPIRPLKAFDTKNRVIYIKSFSKLLMPGLRMGFMVLPKAAHNAVLGAKLSTDIETSGFIQRAFELFLTSGGFARHINKMRQVYKTRYQIMDNALTEMLQNVDYQRPNGGLSFWLPCPEGVSSEDFCAKIYERGAIAAPGALYAVSNSDIPFVRLTFANIENHRIHGGVVAVSEAYRASERE